MDQVWLGTSLKEGRIKIHPSIVTKWFILVDRFSLCPDACLPVLCLYLGPGLVCDCSKENYPSLQHPPWWYLLQRDKHKRETLRRGSDADRGDFDYRILA